MRNLIIKKGNVNLTDIKRDDNILCYKGTDNCDIRCAKFRIAERDYKDLAIMPKNPTQYCYCGTNIIGELK